MSDDEGDDYGDYEDFGAVDEDVIEDGAVTPAAADEDEVDAADEDEAGLEEEAAGTDEEDSGADEEPEPIEPAAFRARAERQKVDPLLRLSNKPRAVIVVPADERETDNNLHKTEAAYVISMRSQQIARYSKCFTEGGGLHDPVALAFKELLDRKCPLILRRTVGTGPSGELIVEEWAVREMSLPPLTPPVPLGATKGSRA